MPKRTSRRGLFTSRNNLFSFGRRKSKQTAGRTITSKRTELGRRLEALEDRRMLAADVEFDTTTSFFADEDGTTNTTGLFVTVSGDDLSTGSSAADRRLRIDLFASGAADASDFSPASQFVTIPALDYTTPITVSLLAQDAGDVTGPVVGLESGGVVIDDDFLIEGTEDFGITVSDFGADIILGNGTSKGVATASASVDITDNDSATISITPSQSVDEDGGTQSFDVELVTSSGGLAELTAPVSFKVDDVAGGSAIVVTDYDDIATVGPLTFAAKSKGGDTMSVMITPVNDRLVEGPETVKFALSDLSGTSGQDVKSRCRYRRNH